MSDITTDQYWSERYQLANTPWDMGSASPPLTGFLQQLADRDQKILIPGAGNAYEAEWLWKNGFKNTWVIDLSQAPLDNLKQRVPDFPSSQLLHGDFFELNQQFDLVVEQTFFCALPPAKRSDYVKKMAAIIRPGGQLFGVLFDFPLTEQGPPFGGSKAEYRSLFEPHFKIQRLEQCYNSIVPRSGNEVFFRLIKA